jgi:hypothetical protein
VKRFGSLQFLNIIDSRYVNLGGGSARHKTATYREPHNPRINPDGHPCLE